MVTLELELQKAVRLLVVVEGILDNLYEEIDDADGLMSIELNILTGRLREVTLNVEGLLGGRM